MTLYGQDPREFGTLKMEIAIKVYLYHILHTNSIHTFYMLLHVSANILNHHHSGILYRVTERVACHRMIKCSYITAVVTNFIV